MAQVSKRQRSWRGELLVGTLAALLGGLAASVVIALYPRLVRVIIPAEVPKSAVVAFDRNDCPPGWEPFSDAKAKFIIGKGLLDDGTDLTKNVRGGQEIVTIGFQNLPPLSVTTRPHLVQGGTTGPIMEISNDGKITAPIVPGPNNNDVSKPSQIPLRIMPPYVALVYCKQLVME